ncbi:MULTISPECIES: cysteine desulfurase sulfur acceptor subunit CsdE [Serratia]|jgi:cysteine desulfuration protein SufE|uniref:Cysteine desulfurase sulfur acceptor subunit CsdE n=4 Tax=Serratia TaxID=613 RepID=A0A0G3SSQ3_SERMA|nr:MULTISPECIES: cysteine desulfurase sulfur acceptor subunit CsdE [Serratia]MBF8220860.1 cysteine desulfurase sulfur acceptor subunit CsdE [Serratia ureilytica]AKL42474.1 Fe-S metabolism protein SufE [Serratia marcescens]ASL89239.1 cysteine desulfurase, sulfur acceptor subunit CsdE [Serratia marcescens]AUY16393.1 cysteine desulfurase sulfur acceptor subunit CsdE [Serratia sp. SSNIH1]AWL69784.1 cysteine desulfurase sulfur acceptor subunit CsdE [Serratia marcescens]
MLAPHPFGREVTAEALIATFSTLKQWEDRYRQLIMLAKRLPPLPEALRSEEIALSGCENRVWLGHQLLEDGTLHFYGDSEGRIVRGLLAVLLTEVEGKTPQQIAALDPLALFDRLALRAQLSATRASGLAALAAAVKAIAARYA